MAETLYALSQADRDTLQAVVQQVLRGAVEPANRPAVNPDDPILTPELYVVRTPGGGIAGRSDGVGTGTGTATADRFRSAVCDVYQLTYVGGLAELTQAFPSVEVYNLSDTDVDGDAWVLAARDKYGTWWLLGAGGGGDGDVSAGYCNAGLAKLQISDCLKFTATPGGITDTDIGPVVTGAPYVGGRWKSDPFEISYPGGHGKVEFWYADGRLHLGIYVPPVSSADPVLMELIPCGDGCWQGGPLTGHGASHGAGECAGETFKVCVECVECPGHTSACCPDITDIIPNSLFLTVSGFVGIGNGTYTGGTPGVGANGTFQLIYEPTLSWWLYPAYSETFPSSSLVYNGGTLYGKYRLECAGGVWYLDFITYNLTSANYLYAATPPTFGFTCSPFDMSFTSMNPQIITGWPNIPCSINITE